MSPPGDKTIWKDSEELSSLDSGGNFVWLNYGDSMTTQGDDTSPHLVGSNPIIVNLRNYAYIHTTIHGLIIAVR